MRSTPSLSNMEKGCSDEDQPNSVDKQVVNQEPPSDSLFGEARSESPKASSLASSCPVGERESTQRNNEDKNVLAEANGIMHMAAEGNVNVITQTTTSGAQFDVDQCKLGGISMCRIRRIITEGKTTLEFTVPEKEGENNEDEGDKKDDDKNDKEEDKKEDEKSDEKSDEKKDEIEGQDPDDPTLDEKKKYDLTPIYVNELVDPRDNELLRRETSSKPLFSNTQRLHGKDSHVLEILTIRSERLTKWSNKEELDEAFYSGKLTLNGIRIVSPLLKNAVIAVIKYYPGFKVKDGSHLCVEWPYKVILHHRNELNDLKSKPVEEAFRDEAEERNRHIDCLLQAVDKAHGGAFQKEITRHQQSTPVATFQHCWVLFKPGVIVYRKTHDIWSAWVVKSMGGGMEHRTVSPYELTLWNLSFDGQMFRRSTEQHFIQPWEGEQAVLSMDVYPADMYDRSLDVNQHSMRERLIERGTKYVKLAQQSYCDYRGRCLVHPKRTYNSAVMIDTAMEPWNDSDFPRWKPVIDTDSEGIIDGCTCRACLQKVEDQKDGPPIFTSCNKLSINSGFTDEQYMICSYWVYGYVLSARRWEILSVDALEMHQDNSDYIEKLVISDENLHMIKAICRTYTREPVNSLNSPWSADTIQGKGEGQIFLLHGKPGVGKTLTAECVAEYTRRPLLALTPGDIGTDPVTVDKMLTRYFKLGESWGAIVLLDEADVYLEARNLHDLERNSLVSVFLRAMEYYQGILFLTTNRGDTLSHLVFDTKLNYPVGSFDEAFASRIHIHLYYCDLDSNDRNKIYDNLVEKLESDREDVLVENRAIDYLRENKNLQEIGWNGRQIRNAFQTAVSLAEYDTSEASRSTQPCKHCQKLGHALENCWVKYPKKKGKKVFVKQRHIEMVVGMSSRFKKYLESARGSEDSKLAKINRLRADNFGKTEEGADEASIS